MSCLILGRTGKVIVHLLFRYPLSVVIYCVKNVVLLAAHTVYAHSLLPPRVRHVRPTQSLILIHVSATLVSPDRMGGIVPRVGPENTPLQESNSAHVTLAFMARMEAIATHVSPENSLSAHKRYAHYVKSESIPPQERRHVPIVPRIRTRLLLVQQSTNANAIPASPAREARVYPARLESTRIL